MTKSKAPRDRAFMAFIHSIHSFATREIYASQCRSVRASEWTQSRAMLSRCAALRVADPLRQMDDVRCFLVSTAGMPPGNAALFAPASMSWMRHTRRPTLRKVTLE